MLCIDNVGIDPYFNLAAEEYLLKNFTENIFMLWQNEPSVIIGKHQDVWTEVNQKFIADRSIKVVRRYTGGGAVYHDLGNLNITFIENSNSLDFNKFTAAMQNFLEVIGIPTQVNKRGALMVNGLKISGSAQCIHGKRMMYHATLLFASDLKDVVMALDGDEEDRSLTSSKYVKSVKSPVANISDYMPSPIMIEEFKDLALNYFMEKNDVDRNYVFNEDDIEAITQLSKERYNTTVWNYNEK